MFGSENAFNGDDLLSSLLRHYYTATLSKNKFSEHEAFRAAHAICDNCLKLRYEIPKPPKVAQQTTQVSGEKTIFVFADGLSVESLSFTLSMNVLTLKIGHINYISQGRPRCLSSISTGCCPVEMLKHMVVRLQASIELSARLM